MVYVYESDVPFLVPHSVAPYYTLLAWKSTAHDVLSWHTLNMVFVLETKVSFVVPLSVRFSFAPLLVDPILHDVL